MRGIVIHPLKIVYWEIPKNASTTLKVYFAKFLGLPFKNPHNAKFERVKEPIPEYFNFALVRNPYDRIWSLYNSWDQVHQKTIYNRFGNFYIGMSWEDYLNTVLSIKDPDPHFKPQHLQIPRGVHIEKIENNLTLAILGKHNSTAKQESPKDPRIYEHYREDFDRFGYEK